MNIWDTLIVQPFAWILLTLYNLVGSYGLAIILFTVVTKLLLLFFSAKGKRGLMQQQRLMPKQQELQKKYKDDKAKYQQAVTKLYQDEGVSPMSGCLWSLLPFPIMIALYGVIQRPLTNLMKLPADAVNKVSELLGMAAGSSEIDMAQRVYENFDFVRNGLSSQGFDVSNLIRIDFSFLGLNLAKVPNLPWQGGWNWLLIIPFISAGAVILSQWLAQKFSGQQTASNMKGMLLLSPILSLWFGFIMPAAMGVYWIAQSGVTIVQEYFLTKHFRKIFDAEDARKADLEARRKAAEEAQKESDRVRRAERIAQQTAQKKPKKYRVSATPKVKEKDPSGEGS